MHNRQFNLNCQILSPREGTRYPENWFVLRHDHLTQAEREQGDYYGNWFRISHGDKCVYRCLRLDPTIAANGIFIDWGARLKLGLRNQDENTEFDLTVKEASLFERIFMVGLKHTDPTVRMNTVLAILGVSLGLVSLVVSIIGVLK